MKKGDERNLLWILGKKVENRDARKDKIEKQIENTITELTLMRPTFEMAPKGIFPNLS